MLSGDEDFDAAIAVRVIAKGYAKVIDSLKGASRSCASDFFVDDDRAAKGEIKEYFQIGRLVGYFLKRCRFRGMRVGGSIVAHNPRTER